MLNDYIEITNGKIVNLSFQVDLFIDKKYPQSQIIANTISVISNYMDINKFEMGQNIYLSNLYELINNVAGVLNIIDLRVYNMVGGKYSINEISQRYINVATKQIDISGEYTIFGEPTTLFEIYSAVSDIIIRVK